MKKINKYSYQEGQSIGSAGIIFIKELSPKIYPRGKGIRKQRIGLFRCNCGNEFKTTFEHIVSGHTIACGCTRKLNFTNKTHGKRSDRLYPVWYEIKERCYNPNVSSYINYGLRGIDVFPIWIADFQSFYDYVTALPDYNKKGYTIDRIDNNKGYFPGNLRWTTRHIQAINSRKSIRNTSGYKGIYKHYDGWIAKIGINGEDVYIGSYKTKEDALAGRNNYIVTHNLSEYEIQSIDK